MNDNDELPPDHYWDSAEAEQEYYEVGRHIEKAEQRAREAAIRYHCEFILALTFRRAYCKAQYHKGYDSEDHYDDISSFQSLITEFHGEWWKKHMEIYGPNLEDRLYLPLNPWWIPPDGRFSSDWAGSFLSSVSKEIGDRLTLCEAKTVPVETFYAYKISFGGFREKLVKYVTFKRVESYTFTDEAAMSSLEWVLLYTKGLLPKIKVEPPFTEPPFDPKEDILAARDIARSRFDELIREVRSFLAPYRKWKFVPYQSPETREAHLVLDLPADLPERERGYAPVQSSSPIASLPPPGIGQRWAVSNWMGMGYWEPRRFPGVEEWLLRLEERFRDKIVATMQKAYQAKDELDQLRRQRKVIRIVHYKPVAYRAFWAILQDREE